MAVIPYFGSYARFHAVDASQNGLLMGADCLVGDEFALDFRRGERDVEVWLENRFGAEVGVLDAEGAGQALLCRAKEWKMRAILASVYAKREGDDAHFWGEVALVAYPPLHEDAFDAFAGGVAKMLAEGVRPQIELQQSSLEQIIRSGGQWRPSGRKKPASAEGSVLIKSSRSLKEDLIEMARDRRPGCLAAYAVFVAVLLAFVVWLAVGAI